MNIEVNIVFVFTGENGKFGSPVGIVLDENRKLNTIFRQKIAADLSLSETVFINNLNEPNISIFNPQREVAFAGHAVLGTVYLINKLLNTKIRTIKCGSETVAVFNKNGIYYIQAPLSIMPSWNHEQLDSASEVENLSEKICASKKHTYVWSWVNEKDGLIRARTFAPDWGISEDEANGSGSMLLSTKLNRSIRVLHGKGSVIYAKPINSGFVEVGGLAVIASKKFLNTRLG